MTSPGPDHQASSPAAPEPAKADHNQTTAQPADPAPAQQQPAQPKPTVNDEEDSDLDDLDDVLDDFSKPKPAPAAPAPAATAATPGAADFNEDAFLKQLEADMANMMGNPAAGGGGGGGNAADLASMEQGADAFAQQLEASGIPPGDFLKQLLSDVMSEESGQKSSAAPGATSGAGSAAASAAAAAASNVAGHGPEQAGDFNDAIQRTMERMKESGERATEAASTDDGLSDDMIAQLLKAVEAGGAGGDEGDLTKMFMGMMEQLSNKEMLYEPMKELDGKFGPWIEKNKAEGKVPVEDMERYETQARVVGQIVKKFEEPGYTDEDPKCREYVWQRMQEMQAAGSPPEELISNPLMEDLGGAAAGAAGGMPDCPQQ